MTERETSAGDGSGPLSQTAVAAVMEPMPAPVAVDMPIEEASRALWLSANGMLPVMGADGHYCGCVTARALAEALDTIEITETSTLAEALDALVGAEGTGAPVLTADEGRLVGWITHRIILTAVQPPAEAGRPERDAQPVTVLRKVRHAERGTARAGP